MIISYQINLFLFFLLGIGHCAMTFKKFRQPEEDAFWFFSAGLGILLCTLLNFVNLKLSNSLIAYATLCGNTLLTLFTIILARNISRTPIKMIAAVSCLIILAVDLFGISNNKQRII